MHDPNRLMKWILVIGLVVLSITILWPPREKLKGGIDLVGGTSMLFEIDTAGLDPMAQRDLSTRVMSVLKDRVDPKGQLNLEWRPVGNSRLEIRMPRPPKEALERRERYNATIEQVRARNITRYDVETALNAGEAARDAALQALVRSVEERPPRIEALKTAYADYLAAQQADDPAATDAASAVYEEAMDSLLATSLGIQRLSDALALEDAKKRDEQLQRLRATFPAYDAGTITEPEGKLITKVMLAYDRWAENKADLEDPSDLKRRIRGAGVLEFRILADRDPNNPTHTLDPNPALKQPISKYTEQLAQYGARPRPGDRFIWLPLQDVLRFLHLDEMSQFDEQKDLPGRPIIEEYAGLHYALLHSDPAYGMLHGGAAASRWKLTAAFPDQNPLTGENVVSFALDARGGRLFGELTGGNVDRDLCIMLDNKAMSYARINERITERCQISGHFSPEQVNDLVRVLEAGSLPARLKDTSLQETTIGPSLGETNRRNGVQAAVWGAVAVVVFVVIYYGIVGGGGTSIALTLNLLITVAIMALMQATFTLPGIAGLLLSIGMAIDANVLIFERIREERARGVVFKKALILGYDKAFSAILDGNLTTMITCVILGFVGSEEIKGFAITLGIGIGASMFTALTVTRLIYTTLVSKDLLSDFSMRKLIGVPNIDWIALRKVFWPASTVAVVVGLGLFFWLSAARTESFFDIEFLGGTSLQLDLKPGIAMNDEQVRDAITATERSDGASAVQWLRKAAAELPSATASLGDTPGQFTLTSETLSGDQLAVLMRRVLDPKLERDGVSASGSTARFESRPGALTLEDFEKAMGDAATEAQAAADRLRGSRVQTVGAGESTSGLSYEVVTVETNRPLIQAAILSVLGDRLAVQRAIRFEFVRDEELTKEPFFVIESDDQYLSDVIGGDAPFDVRPYRGGVAVQAKLDDGEAAVTVAEFERRLREVGLQPEFEQFRAREWAVYPLGQGIARPDATVGYKQFVVCSVDESLSFDDDAALWTEAVARTEASLVQAALGSEKSFSKVIQFAPQIAGQTRNRALFAIVLSMVGIGAYVWLRFGTRDYGLAILVTMAHDVCIVLGLIAASHWVHDTIFGRILLLEGFKFDLTMLAAVLTIIGYQLNDTIVVYDRIRENRGKLGSLSPGMINASINQTMSRTILTATLVTLTVITLYVFGGAGIHGFAFAMLTGTLAGTYSTVAIAVPLLYRPKVLHVVVVVMVALGLIGLLCLQVSNSTARLVVGAVIALGCLGLLLRGRGALAAASVGRAAPA